MLIRVFSFIFFLSVCLSIIDCSGNKEEKTVWGKAAKFVKAQSSKNYIENEDVVFLSLDQEHNPSAWVEYFFSVYSTRNWITENDEYAEYSRGPVLPSGIRLMKSERNDTLKTPQLVVKADDANSMIIVEGYNLPGEGIVYKDEWGFPKFK